VQEIEGFSDRQAPARGGGEFPRSDEARGQRAAAPSRELDPRSILGSLNAVVYDWDIASDRLSWGANVGETLAAFSAGSLASGAAFAELVTADSDSSRFQAIHNASTRDEGEGAPYRAAYRLAQPDGASRATRTVGRRARTAFSGSSSETKNRVSTPRRRIRANARARCRPGARSTKRSNRASLTPSRATRFSRF
jgi:hypothetical protein